MSTDYKAKTWSTDLWDGIIVFPVFGFDEPYGKGTYTTKDYRDFAIFVDGYGTSPASAENFVEMFNAAVGTSLGYNTQYPQHIISSKLDPDTSVPQAITALTHAGYVTITTPDSNSGTVYVGGDDVDSTSYALAADKSVYMELDDLSKIYIYASTPGDICFVLGAYKH